MSNKKLLKNTLILYGRKVISIILGLLSARYLLLYLGIDDYGLYGLIGSVIGVFASIRGVFSSSVQRFINIERGKGSLQNHEGLKIKVNEIFSAGLYVHFWIGVLFFIIVNAGGLIILEYVKLGANKWITGFIILESAIISSVISIFTVPYDALIISHERFNTYALFAVLDSIFRFIIVLSLIFFSDRVIVYSLLLLLVTALNFIFNYISCRCIFPIESKYKFIKNKDLLKRMTSFAGWQFFGSTGYTVSNQGMNFVLNHFGGVAINASRSIAYQLMNTVQQFVLDISMSFQPRSMMEYVSDYSNFIRLFYFNSKLSFAICFMITFPIFLITGPILKIWLTEIPDYTIPFVQCILLYLLIRSLHGAIDILFKSSGEIKTYQLIEFIVMLSCIPLGYVALLYGKPFYWVFLIMCIMEVVNLLSILLLAKSLLDFDLGKYFKSLIIPIILIGTISFLVYFYQNQIIPSSSSIASISIELLTLEILSIMLIWFLLMNKNERSLISKYLYNKLFLR